MSIEIAREYSFCAAHMIQGHPKCGRLHGHNYLVTVWVVSGTLTEGMIIDYGALDRLLKPYFDRFDHRLLVSDSNVEDDNPYIKVAVGAGDAVRTKVSATTGELLARMFAMDIEELLPHGITVARVVVQETAKSWAVYNCD